MRHVIISRRRRQIPAGWWNSAALLLVMLAGCAQSRWTHDPALTDLSATDQNYVRTATTASPVVRCQQPAVDPYAASIYQNTPDNSDQLTAGSDELTRQSMAVSGQPVHGLPQSPANVATSIHPAQYSVPAQYPPQPPGVPVGGPHTGRAPAPGQTVYQGVGPPNTGATVGPLPGNPYAPPPSGAINPGWPGVAPVAPTVTPPPFIGVPNPNAPPGPVFPTPVFGPDARFADVIVNLQEAPTGRLMIGAAVNSEAGITGQIVIDERNFDWRNVPTSWDDVISGRAFRGGGQTFRLEALPGSNFERYQVSFAEPFLLNTRVSLDLSGYLFTRSYFDWNEERLGGRVGLGYRITPDLSISGQFRGEEVKLSNPRVPGVPELEAALGRNEVYGTRFAMAYDTRDLPFAPTQGQYLEFSFEQVFGTFDYPRGVVDWRRYFLVTERPDGSGRHVLGFSNRLGITGAQTPIYDNFFAGGYSTLRGFNLRGASPTDLGVIVGGELQLLGSVEYVFPITADDMLRGVFFVDYGTVEEDIRIRSENYRLALGAGARINIPAMGPAPIAVDFAVPVARAATDDIQNVSFFLGVSR